MIYRSAVAGGDSALASGEFLQSLVYEQRFKPLSPSPALRVLNYG